MIFLFFFVAKPIIGMDVPRKFIQAAMIGNLEALQDLEPQISGAERANILSNALYQAIKAKKYGAIKYFLTLSDININAKVSGITPIHAAARTNDVEIVRLLLATGKVNAAIPSDGTNFTPLIDAAAQGNLAIVKLLLETSDAQKSINQKDYASGFTALNYAYEINKIEGVEPERVDDIRKEIIGILRSYGGETQEDLLTLSELNNLYQQLQLLNYQLISLAQKMAAIK